MPTSDPMQQRGRTKQLPPHSVFILVLNEAHTNKSVCLEAADISALHT